MTRFGGFRPARQVPSAVCGLAETARGAMGNR